MPCQHEPEMGFELSGVHTELSKVRIVLKAAHSHFQMWQHGVSSPILASLSPHGEAVVAYGICCLFLVCYENRAGKKNLQEAETECPL